MDQADYVMKQDELYIFAINIISTLTKQNRKEESAKVPKVKGSISDDLVPFTAPVYRVGTRRDGRARARWMLVPPATFLLWDSGHLP